MNFKTFLVGLHEALQKPGAVFPRNDFTLDTMKKHGLAYFVEPATRTRPKSDWYDNTYAAVKAHAQARARGEPKPDWTKFRILYLVNWPHFLWQARAASQSPIAPLARQLLFLLMPLVESVDYVFACDLAHYAKRYWAASEDVRATSPGFFGQDNEVDEQRFRNHLERVLASKLFRKHLKLTMNASLQSARALGEEHRLGLCPRAKLEGARHGPRTSCDACRPQRWLRHATNLIRPDRLSAPHFFNHAQLRFVFPKVYGHAPKRWPAEVRYILDSMDPTDGAYLVRSNPRAPGTTLVNFTKLLERAVKQERESVLTEFRVPGLMNEHWYTASRIRLALPNVYGTGIIAPRTKELRTMVLEAGWEWKDNTADIPYELYNTQSLLDIVAKDRKTARALLKAQRSPIETRLRQGTIRRITVALKTPEGDVIQVFRRRSALQSRADALTDGTKYYFFFQLPFEVPDPKRPLERYRNDAVQVENRWLWSTRKINAFANEGIPRAKEFLAWALGQEIILREPRAWRRALFNTRFDDRVTELRTNKRKHIGPLTDDELAHLRRIMVERKGPGKLKPEEWMELAKFLPHRKRIGILRQIEALGKEFALEHGWYLYTKSPWCLQRSAKRRARWMKEGVRP